MKTLDLPGFSLTSASVERHAGCVTFVPFVPLIFGVRGQSVVKHLPRWPSCKQMLPGKMIPAFYCSSRGRDGNYRFGQSIIRDILNTVCRTPRFTALFIFRVGDCVFLNFWPRIRGTYTLSRQRKSGMLKHPAIAYLSRD